MPAEQLLVQLLGAPSGLLERVGELRTAVGTLRAKLAELSNPMRTNRHRQPGLRRLRVFFAVLVFVLAACASGAQTQTPPSVSTPVDSANSRPCSANPVLAPSNKGKHAPKTKHRLPPEPAPACLEVKGGGIEVQEFLQNTAREQQWRVGENHASEDTWTFVRYFNSDELSRYADTNVLNEPVKFTSGKAAVLVRTSDVENGYVRVQVTVHFQGNGKSTDKVWAQPGDVWPLNSKGVLEQEILKPLQTEYKSISWFFGPVPGSGTMIDPRYSFRYTAIPAIPIEV